MSLGFLDHMRVVPDHREPQASLYPSPKVQETLASDLLCKAAERAIGLDRNWTEEGLELPIIS
jgi:hypothetical protein